MYLKIWYLAIIRLNCKRSNFDAQKSQILQFWLISSYPYFHPRIHFWGQNGRNQQLRHRRNADVTFNYNLVSSHTSKGHLRAKMTSDLIGHLKKIWAWNSASISTKTRKSIFWSHTILISNRPFEVPDWPKLVISS